MAAEQEDLSTTLKRLDYPLINAFSGKYRDWLRKYYYVGGMPEAVKCYFETDNMAEVREIQKQLLLYYENYFSKHAPREQLPRIQMVWNSIPAQLAKENRKFIYGIVREGARAKDFELAIRWLSDYGLILKSFRVKKPGMPLGSYMEQNSFKLFMLDVGLLAAKGDLPAKALLEGSRVFEEFKGALTEQDDLCIPVEVKAEENLMAKSLRAYCLKYHPETAVRTSMSDYREESWMTNVPLYVIGDYLAE